MNLSYKQPDMIKYAVPNRVCFNLV